MAAHYIKEMRELQPNGPYFIGGRSLGGMVAFEMAQQLRERGEQVGLLALLDTYPSGYAKLLRDQTTVRAFRSRREQDQSPPGESPQPLSDGQASIPGGQVKVCTAQNEEPRVAQSL